MWQSSKLHTVVVMSAMCFLRLTFRYNLKKSVCLLYPLIVQFCLFGHHNVVDFMMEFVSHEQPSLTRYKSAQQEMKYIFKSIVFDSLQALYLIVLIPIYFGPSNSIYVDFEQYEMMSYFYLSVNSMYYLVYYLDKRYFEMQFNSHVIGGWNRLFEENSH